MRLKLDEGAVAQYAQDVKNGDKFPPVQACWDGETYWLWNGFHRVKAWQIAGLKTIYTEVRPGTQRYAQYLALGANKKIGVRPSRDDNRRAIFVMLRDPEWCHEHNTAVARHIGVDEGTVRTCREEVLKEVFATKAGARLTDAEVREKTGSTSQLIRKVRLQLHPPTESPESPKGGPGGSENPNPEDLAEEDEDVVAGLSSYERAVWEGLSEEDRQAYLTLNRDEVEEDAEEAQARRDAAHTPATPAERLERLLSLCARVRKLVSAPPELRGADRLLAQLEELARAAWAAAAVA